MTHVLRHFSYAPQRFESFSGPRVKYACLLNACCILLAKIASDQRQPKDVRVRAEASLDAMTAKDVLECGLAADFAEQCYRRRPQSAGPRDRARVVGPGPRPAPACRSPNPI